MKNYIFFFLIVAFFSCSGNESSNNSKVIQDRAKYAIVIHGGAGTILKENMSDSMETAYLQKLNEALDKGESMLKNGASSLDAVVETIKIMEESPLFNAGKGAVFANNEKNELDASIMVGKTQKAGAVAGVTRIKSPITAAKKVMEDSDHVLLAGLGAEKFASDNGCEMVDPKYFYTERRMKSLLKSKSKEDTGHIKYERADYKFGTVGCVALDKRGNIVAGTSTGGMTNKKWNRIGDSPIIGAGTYADNATCGVSSTGHGEYFIRYAVAYDIAARMAYKEISLEQAANEVVMEKLVKKGGSGGIIALDSFGNITMPFNTKGMYRGYAKPSERVVKIYGE